MAMRRMLLENEEALLDALKKDLRRSRFVSLVFELWDIAGQVCGASAVLSVHVIVLGGGSPKQRGL